MAITTNLIAEMERCLKALRAYQHSYDVLKDRKPDPNRALITEFYLTSLPTHASAQRATMDVTKLLAKWRQTNVNWKEPK